MGSHIVAPGGRCEALVHSSSASSAVRRFGATVGPFEVESFVLHTGEYCATNDFPMPGGPEKKAA
jgi:hypothetical protein